MRASDVVVPLSELRRREGFTLIDDRYPSEAKIFTGVYMVMEPAPGISVDPDKVLAADWHRGVVWTYNKTTQVRRIIRD